ncbi:uncharacterized protein LOC111323227 [Stylophora pistillata]|uniref:uncharacterized protein LOC111323227 n=1 Tax=Stylophora pistillata TaxID=50429 RepID=UPI000C041036|nr:uncharacterized protein LOC111323227 [Stylophora pistillata]
MESARIPMRGKVKDAEAEALLKLLRREKEFNDRLSAPQIHQRTPLPAIGDSGNNTTTLQTTSCDRTNGTFLTQTFENETGPALNSDIEHSKELVSDSKYLWSSKGDVNSNFQPPSSLKEFYIPPFTWKGEQSSCYTKHERQRHGRTLPPLEIPVTPDFDLPERPSCPKPGSPKFWED